MGMNLGAIGKHGHFELGSLQIRSLFGLASFFGLILDSWHLSVDNPGQNGAASSRNHAEVAILHGTADEVVPCANGKAFLTCFCWYSFVKLCRKNYLIFSRPTYDKHDVFWSNGGSWHRKHPQIKLKWQHFSWKEISTDHSRWKAGGRPPFPCEMVGYRSGTRLLKLLSTKHGQKQPPFLNVFPETLTDLGWKNQHFYGVREGSGKLHPTIPNILCDCKQCFCSQTMFGKTERLQPRKFTRNQRITLLKRKFIFQTSIFGFGVSFRG